MSPQLRHEGLSRVWYVLAAIALIIAFGIAVTNPAVVHDAKFWTDYGMIWPFVLFIVAVIRETNRSSRERGIAMRAEVARLQHAQGVAVKELPSVASAADRFVAWAFLLALGIAMFLGSLYFLVRFVKWAWTD